LTEKEQIENYLKKYHLNDILDDSLRADLKLYYFTPGQHIVRNDEPLKHFYFFVEGKAKVYSLLENGKSLLVRFYNPLEIIGEVELFTSGRNICNVQAINKVTCIGINSDRMKQKYKENNQLLIYLCKSLSNKLLNFNISSSINLTYPLENRLAGYLVAITEKNEQIQTDNLSELADLLGTSYRHLTRTISNFSKKGIIIKKKNEFEILNREKLEYLAKEIYT
jgi:CRP/FNR family putative post-exponential-phase nitrogen-starvation transcriptional regulator